MRELGFTPLPVPAAAFHKAARAACAVPRLALLPPATDWVEALSHPAIMDTTKAREKLGWRPKYSALEALRDTLRQAAGYPAEAHGARRRDPAYCRLAIASASSPLVILERPLMSSLAARS